MGQTQLHQFARKSLLQLGAGGGVTLDAVLERRRKIRLHCDGDLKRRQLHQLLADTFGFRIQLRQAGRVPFRQLAQPLGPAGWQPGATT